MHQIGVASTENYLQGWHQLGEELARLQHDLCTQPSAMLCPSACTAKVLLTAIQQVVMAGVPAEATAGWLHVKRAADITLKVDILHTWCMPGCLHAA